MRRRVSISIGRPIQRLRDVCFPRNLNWLIPNILLYIPTSSTLGSQPSLHGIWKQESESSVLGTRNITAYISATCSSAVREPRWDC